jgi:acyl-CoA synthetase (AMP-forming)/AMP-acid ligase II
VLREAPADAEAIEVDGVWWTWGDVRRVAGALDALLTENGAGAGSRIGVALENQAPFAAIVIALLSTGRCLATLSPLQPAERLAADIGRSAPPVVVGSAEVLDRPGVLDAITAQGLAVAVGADGGLTVAGGAVPADAEDGAGVAVEMLTSGTTGPPKRVRLGDHQLQMALNSSGQHPKPGRLLATGTAMGSNPLVHIGGLWTVIANWYVGRRFVLLPKFNVEAWLRAVETYQLRSANLVPAALRVMYDANVDPARMASLQVVLCGTAPCPSDLATAFTQRYGPRVLSTYGATEFAGAVAGWTLPLHKEWWDRKAGSIGRPFPGVRMRIVDAEGEPLGIDVVGHLELQTSQVPAAANGWTRTSDLARIDADGFVWITGRADDAIIRGGFKIQPEHVKQILELHPAVREAAVAGLPDERLGQVPVAAVQPEPGVVAPTPAELDALARQHLTPYEVPAHIVVTAELPRTPTLKVSRVDLLALIRAEIAAS